MATNKKMTKADYFRQIMANYSLTEDEKTFVKHELELLEKKNSGDKKPTKLQEANENIKDAIYAGMEKDTLYTVTDIIKTIPACAELTNQKVSALINQMCPDRVERTVAKGRTYFKAIK